MKEDQQLNILYEWDSISHFKPRRGKIWYTIFFSIVILAIIISLYTDNFLLTIIVILLATILIMEYTIPVKILEIVLTDNAIVLDGKTIYYHKIRHFWLGQNHGINYLYFQLINSDAIKNIPILEEANPLKIRELLLNAQLIENTSPPEESVWENFSLLLRL